MHMYSSSPTNAMFERTGKTRGTDFCNELGKPAVAGGKGSAPPAEESQCQIVDDKILNTLGLPLLICHKTDEVSETEIDTSIAVPGKGRLLVFTVTFNFRVGGHLHWKGALLWQRHSTTTNVIGTKSDWKDAASILRNEKVRIRIGQINEAGDHPLMQCLKDTMQ